MIRCKQCEIDLDEAEFYKKSRKRKDGSVGLRQPCKSCWIRNSVERQRKNPEKNREKARNCYRRHSEKYLRNLRERRNSWSDEKKNFVGQQSSAYREKNRHILKEKRREKYDKKAQSVLWKKYYDENRDLLLQKKKAQRSNLSDEQKEQVRENIRRWQSKNPEKVAAHSKVYFAIKSGALTRPSLCSQCGISGRIDAHHPDYSKPLDVIWLCKFCHAKAHR